VNERTLAKEGVRADDVLTFTHGSMTTGLKGGSGKSAKKATVPVVTPLLINDPLTYICIYYT
jgi:hypothetical protein